MPPPRLPVLQEAAATNRPPWVRFWEPWSEIWSNNDGVISIYDGQSNHLFCIFFRHLLSMAYLYWYTGL